MNPPVPAFSGGCWPDAAQADLLRACLQPEFEAREAWKRWRERVDFEEVDGGSFRLLGLAFRRVSPWGLDDPVLPRLKGIYRKFWARNQMVLAGKAALIDELQRAGISTMLLKGAALIPTVYRDAGTRPMDDFDLLVPKRCAKDAMAVLLSRGWKSEFLNRDALVDSLHACHFQHPRDGNLDLHWHPLHAPSDDEADTDFWNGREAILWEGINTSVLQPADQLLHACEHGPRFNSVPPIRWLADAWKIIHSAGPALDWNRLCRQAVHRQLTLPVRLTLEWLEHAVGPATPPEVLRDLRARRITVFERAEYRLAQRPIPPVSTVLQRLPLNLCYYWRLKRRAGVRRLVRDLPTFLQHINNLDKPPQRHLREHLGYVWNVRLPIHWNRLRRARAARPEEIESIAPHDLTGFHLLEPWKGRNFRWSEPHATVRFRREPACLRITLDFGGLRAWRGDLDQSLTIHFNTHAVALREVSPTKLSFDAHPEMFAHTVYQRIVLRCVPLAARPPETRQLGLPLFAVSIAPAAARIPRP